MSVNFKEYMEVPTSELSITSNGTYDVTEKASAVVNVPTPAPTLQDKTITANGTYSADAGYDGLDEVIVNVPAPAPVGVVALSDEVSIYSGVTVNQSGNTLTIGA